MTILTRISPSISEIEFYPLSAIEWRVSDRRFPRHSIEALLGFVAKQGEFYYVTRMRHPLESTPLANLELVARLFASEFPA